jgi:hypothetical protein
MNKYDSTSERLNDVAMNGFAEEEYSSCQWDDFCEGGFWAALIITHDLYGIIQEDNQGLVDYEVHTNENDARNKWEDMVKDWQRIFNPEEVWA